MNKFKTRYPSQILTAMLLLSSMACAAEDLNDGLTEEEALAEAMRLSSLIAQPAPAPIAHQDVDLSEEEQLQIALAMSETEAPRPSPAAAARPAPQRDPFVDFYAPYVPPADPFPPAAAPKPAPAVAKSIIKRQSEIFYFGEVQYPDSPLPKPGEPKPSAAAAAPSSSRRPPAEDIFDFRAPAYPRAASPTSQARQQDLQDLAAYIERSRFDIPGQFKSIVERLHFITMPFCFLQDTFNFSENPLEDIKIIMRKDLVALCEAKGFSYQIVLPLFEHYFTRHLDRVVLDHPFTKTLSRITQAICRDKATLLPLITAMNKAPTPEAEEKVTQRFQTLGIIPLYDTLEGQYPHFKTYIYSCNILSEVFLRDAPPIDLTRLLCEPKPKVTKPQVLPVEFAKAQVLPPEIEKKEEPKRVMRQKLEDVAPGVLVCQGFVTAEFQARVKASGHETVMGYGQTVAPAHYTNVEAQINKLWELLMVIDPFTQQNVSTLKIEGTGQIQELYNKYKGKEDLELKQAQCKAIDSALNNSYDRHTRRDVMPIDLGGKSQYDYLLMVASQVYRFNQAIRPQNKDLANDLLGAFFNTLVDQERACPTGMVGRMLMTHKKTLDMLIDYYQTPLKS